MSQRLRRKQRQERILEQLRTSPHVRISVLADRFAVTTETIRRDLDALSEMGLVDRAYGGASARPMGLQPAAHERGAAFVAERGRIGAAAAALIGRGEVVMIDAGSTTQQLARHLAEVELGLTIVSNCHLVAGELAANGGRLVMCPGEFDGREAAVYGNDTVEFLRRFHANKSFVGASGLAADGFSDVNRAAVWVKRAMMERAEETWLLVDHSKFDARLLEVVAPLGALAGLVADRAPTGALRAAIERAGLRLVVAAPAG